jgi:hypothetical protein
MSYQRRVIFINYSMNENVPTIGKQTVGSWNQSYERGLKLESQLQRVKWKRCNLKFFN